ncbi:MAG: hypothetical protein WB677_25120 [Xanthobacteraceae bacterium]
MPQEIPHEESIRTCLAGVRPDSVAQVVHPDVVDLRRLPYLVPSRLNARLRNRLLWV